MFQNYVATKTLDINEYNKKMKEECSEGMKYCNAFCQSFLPITDFHKDRANCKICFAQIKKARSMIDTNQLTMEQFRNNPSLVSRESIEIPVFRNCKTCKEDLSLDRFEAYRKECIDCRKKKKKINYEDQFKEQLPAIEASKQDISTLSNIIKGFSADILKLVVKHYKIHTVSEERTKDKLVVYIVDHFKALLNPLVCLGTCGNILETEFSVCDVCKNHPKSMAEEKLIEFEKGLDDLIPTLTSMKKEDSFKYNKKEIRLIATKLGIKYYKTMDKPVIMELIDAHLEKQRKEDGKVILADMGGEINLNGITILSREDGFINATALCKAGGKKFKHWVSLDSSIALVSILTEQVNALAVSEDATVPFLKVEIPTFKKIEVVATEKGKYGGSWVHPDLAVQIAQWVSPVFALRVSKWVRELATTGTVTVGQEKTNLQLMELQKENKKIKNELWKIKQKKHYHKFKKGPSFYIISDLDGKSAKFKPGFEGVDVFTRLQQHRSTMPGCKLEYLLYSKNADLVEKNVLKRFESKRTIANHEWIFDLDIEFIIKTTRGIMSMLGIEYTEEEDLEEYNEQIDVDFL
jgi:hypothetical protein